MPIDKTCEHCGGGFRVPPARADTARFCGRGCADAHQIGERRTLKCARCGSDFEAAKDHGIWPKYCSRSCFLSGCVRPEQKECESCGSYFLAGRSATATRGDGLRLFCSKACADEAKRKSEERACVHCGAKFYPVNVTQNPDQRTCSQKCASEFFVGSLAGGYKRGYYTHTNQREKHLLLPRPGYVSRYFPEHRLVASRVLGRLVKRHEVVLRVNRNPDDNRPENLFVCGSMSEFARRKQGSLPWPTKSNLSEYEVRQ